VLIFNELFMFDLLVHTDCGRMVRHTEVIHDGHLRISTGKLTTASISDLQGVRRG
jgi:hypothetical protein